MVRDIVKGKIRKGWWGAGKEFQILGPSINVKNQYWTPILYDGEEDPDFLKTEAIELINNSGNEKE